MIAQTITERQEAAELPPLADARFIFAIANVGQNWSLATLKDGEWVAINEGKLKELYFGNTRHYDAIAVPKDPSIKYYIAIPVAGQNWPAAIFKGDSWEIATLDEMQKLANALLG